jgi:hypothetical protein
MRHDCGTACGKLQNCQRGRPVRLRHASTPLRSTPARARMRGPHPFYKTLTETLPITLASTAPSVQPIVTYSSHDGRAIGSTERAIAGFIKSLWNSVKLPPRFCRQCESLSQILYSVHPTSSLRLAPEGSRCGPFRQRSRGRDRGPRCTAASVSSFCITGSRTLRSDRRDEMLGGCCRACGG